MDVTWNFDKRQTMCVGRNNQERNRYPSILPYDSNRIVLSKTCNDYINASLIKIDEEKTIIATQGPLLHTIHDFWSMVLQDEETDAIFALTRLVEEQKTKCAPYWPREGDMVALCCGAYCTTCPNIKITHVYTKNSDHCIVTKLAVSDGKRTKEVTHYHIVDWSDHQPPNGNDFDALISEVEKCRKAVVHCSAGAGRTALIAILLHGIREKKNYQQCVEWYSAKRLSVLSAEQCEFAKIYLSQKCEK
jgi:protein tyrosine phosphatase